MITYKGFEVMDLRPTRDGAAAEKFLREMTILNSGTGHMAIEGHSPAPAPARSFRLPMFSRYQVTLLRAFLDRCHGRDTPFWMPSYQRDLSMTADLASGAAALTVKWFDYTAQMFPQSLARRHLVLYDPTLNFSCYKVTAATDPGSKTTETLTLSPNAERAFPAGSTLVSFLKFCRLDTDLVPIGWWNGSVSEATLTVRELPNEVPS